MDRRHHHAWFQKRGSVSRRSFLGLTAGLTAGLASAALVGCSSSSKDPGVPDGIDELPDNVNAEGFPIVKEPLTLTFMSGHPPQTAKDWNTVASWKAYQDKTDITVDWGPVTLEALDERRNLALSSGDYPAVIYGGRPTALDVGKYGEQGIFLQWNELIDSYMPNLKALLDKHPEFRAGMTFPDGKIYGLPSIQDPDFTALKMKYKLWVRSDWMERVGAALPRTVDDFTAYLKGVKKAMPNGDNTVPYGGSIDGIYHSLSGAFDIGNQGATQPYIDVDPSGDALRFIPTSEGYRQLVTHLHQLYADGLIASNVFASDKGKFNNEASQGIYGSLVTTSPSAMYGKVGDKYEVVPALEGPGGHKSWNYVYSRLISIGNFLITDKCTEAVAAARWIDYFYGDEGAQLFFMGVEDESYETTPDGPEYLPKIENPPGGKTSDEALRPYVTYMGGGYPGIVKDAYFKGAENTKQAVDASLVIAPDALESALAEFIYSSEEARELGPLSADIEKYADESRDRFISGDLKIEKDWDAYVETFNKMGLEDYLALNNTAYERLGGN